MELYSFSVSLHLISFLFLNLDLLAKFICNFFYSLVCLPNLGTMVIWALNLHWGVSVAGKKMKSSHLAFQAVVPLINCSIGCSWALPPIHFFLIWSSYRFTPIFCNCPLCIYIDAILSYNLVHIQLCFSGLWYFMFSHFLFSNSLTIIH